MRNRLALLGAVLAVIITVACSNDEPVQQASPAHSPSTTIAISEGTPSPVQVVGSPASGVGPGLSVADAIASTLEGPLLVNGFIFTETGDVWLCDSLLHGDPTAADLVIPGSVSEEHASVWEEHAMCGEPRIEVSGLDPATVESFESHEDAGWTNETTQVLGVMIDGVLTVSGAMLAR